MGVQGLPAELKEGIPRTFLELSGLRGKTLGIDSSVVLYTALRSSPETLAQYFAEPKVPVKAFCASHMKSMLTVLQRAGIKCVWVFDGADHQNKSLVSERRSSSRAQNIADLTLCLQRGNTEDIMNAPKLKSDIMHPRSDIIFEAVEWLKENGQEVVGAPFEADWQLIELELSGKTDGTLTVDSDLFVLGSKCLVLDFKLCKVPNKQEDSATCLIIERQACLRKLEHRIFGAESANQFDDLSVLQTLACFLGCDYLPRVHGNGVKAVSIIMRKWCASGMTEVERNNILASHNGKNYNEDNGICTDFHTDFYNCRNAFQFAPVFYRSQEVTVAAAAHDLTPPWTTLLVPISRRDSPEPITEEVWKEKLGFLPRWAMLLACPSHNREDSALSNLQYYNGCYTMEMFAKNGSKLPDNEIPPLVHNGIIVPAHAIINWNLTPVWSLPTFVLIAYLECRRRPIKGSQSNLRDTVMEQVSSLLKISKDAGLNIDDQIFTLAVNDRTGSKYLNWEPIHTGPEGAKWITTTDPQFLDELRSDLIQELSDESIAEIVSNFRSGVLQRASKLENGGNFDYDGMKLAHAKVHARATTSTGNNLAHQESVDVVIFQCCCCPSVKPYATGYTVMVVFECCAGGGKYIPAPCSRCSCPKGCFLCSHMIALITDLSIMRNRELQDVGVLDTFAELRKGFPEYIKATHSIPVSVRYAVELLELKRKNKKAAANKQRCKSTPRAATRG